MISLFDKILLIVIVLLAIVCIILAIDNKILKDERNTADSKVDDLNTKLNDQNNAIHQLVIAQQEKQNQILAAETEVKKMSAKFDKQAEDLLNQNIPTNCDAAVAWGAKQGPLLNKCWVTMC